MWLCDSGDGVVARETSNPTGSDALDRRGMLNYMEEHPDGEYIVATENGCSIPSSRPHRSEA